jgi:phosphoglycolate phosphatase
LKLVLFDCDGTLVDSQHMIVSAMDSAFQRQGIAPPPRLQTLSVVGLSLSVAVRRLLPQSADAALIESLAEDYKTAFGELRSDPANTEPMYPGMRDLVLDLAARDNTVLGVATGKSARGVAMVLAREQLGHAFRTVQTADSHPSKPDPSMIFEAMADTGAAPDDTILIGDTTFDVEMAVAAGVDVIGVSWGYHPVDELKAAGAGQVISTAAELREALDVFLTRATRAA